MSRTPDPRRAGPRPRASVLAGLGAAAVLLLAPAPAPTQTAASGPATAPQAKRGPGPPRDMLVVLNKADNAASIIDIASRKTLGLVRLGIAPHEAELIPGGRVVVVSNYGTKEAAGRTLTVVDLKTMSAAGTVVLPDGARPHGLEALSSDRMLVTAEGLKELIVVEPLKRRMVSRIPLGSEIPHMVVASRDGKRAFIANIGSGSVTVVDLLAEKVAAEIPTGAGAEGLDLRPGSAELWVGNRGANTISVVDTSRLGVAATVPVRDQPIRVKFTPDGRLALVSCTGSGDVAVFDASTRKEIHRIPLDRNNSGGTAPAAGGKGPAPVGILVAPDGKRAWVASTNADVVSVIDLERFEVVDRITAGREPDGLAATFRIGSGPN